MYIYPDNLKAKATMWLWSLKDLAIVGIIILFSVFAFAYAGVWFPLVIAGAYAFLTIQVEDTTIMDFIRYACAYFFMDHGISGRGSTQHRKCFCQNLDVSDPVGTCHRRFLAVLFPCTADRRCG